MKTKLREFLARWIRERGQEVSIKEALREVQEELTELRVQHGHNPLRSARYPNRMLQTKKPRSAK